MQRILIICCLQILCLASKPLLCNNLCKLCSQDLTVVYEFVCLGSLIHLSTGSTCDISCRSAITRAATQSFENQIWRSPLAISTMSKLYNTCILLIFLYGSNCWAISKTDARKIDALDHWTSMLLGIKWYQFVRNDDVRRLAKQLKLTAIIQLRWLTLFGHIMRMDDNADAKKIPLASSPADWRRQPGRPRITWFSTVQQDLKHHHHHHILFAKKQAGYQKSRSSSYAGCPLYNDS